MRKFEKISNKMATLLGAVILVVLVISVGTVYALNFHSASVETADGDQEIQTSQQQTQATVEETTQKEQAEKESSKETTKERKTAKSGNAAKNTSGKEGEGSAKTKKETKSKKLSCKLTISCKTALDSSELQDSKRKVLPANGVLYGTKEVEFQKGDSVYDVLRRETKKSGIHMESVKSPGYNTQYIKGIGNLYEFDCGDLSGWMYKVNGAFPNYGCSGYTVKNGDDIQFLYSCELGDDIGGSNY